MGKIKNGIMMAIIVVSALLLAKGLWDERPVPPYQVRLAENAAISWPPQSGKPYPDLELVDHKGRKIKLSSFKGKVIVVEPLGMTCEACNAFSGGVQKGGFKNVGVQSGLDSIEHYFPTYTGGISLHDPRIIFVQLLLYNMVLQGPTPEDAALWAEHFGLDKYDNTYVLAGGPALIGRASYNMIPGFQLIDKNFILRSDSTGHFPKDGLWDHLLPMVPKLLKE